MNDSTLENDISSTRNSLSTDRLDMSFGEIMSMYERDELIIDPEFQRLFRWTDYQKTRFIESLLLGIPIPPIFVAEDENGRWELVDGLQRLSTVLSFFGLLKSQDKNGWVMVKGELIESLDGYSISNLPLKFQLNIKRAVCRIEVIKWNSKIDMRYELFNRLNTGGSPLTDQEIRNCIFRGITSNFNNFLKRVANNEKFIKLIEPTERQISELYLEELVLRFASLYKNSPNVKSDISVHMTNFMRDAVKNPNFDYLFYESLFNRVVDLLAPIGHSVFRGRNGGFSTSLYEAITIGIASNIDYYESNPRQLTGKIELLKGDAEFRENMGSASNNKLRIVKRIAIAERIFQPT